MITAAVAFCMMGSTPGEIPRPFRMGFTPFPYDISFEAVDFSYQAIGKHADLIMQHFDDGVPWQEAYENKPYPKKYQDDIQDRKRRTPASCHVLLSMTPMNFERTGLAKDLSEKPAINWTTVPLDDPRVHQAYLNHIERMIALFHPDYVNFCIEANLLMDKAPEKWPGYMKLHRELYTELKKKHPATKFFASVVASGLIDPSAQPSKPEIRDRTIRDVESASDYTAYSFYPYMTQYMAESIPDSIWSRVFDFAHKPVVIAESGYPGAEFRIHNNQWIFRGTPDKQAVYMTRLLEEANKRHFAFVVNFVVRDYDALWHKIGDTDLGAVWKATGLFDPDGHGRPSLAVWDKWLARPYSATK